MNKTAVPILFLSASLMVSGQTVTPGRAFVRAFGEATVAARPDMARMAVHVTTQATTAQEASAQNATKATAVFEALEQLLGSSGELRTISYTVNPIYSTQRDTPPTITGYTATNTVEVTMTNLTNTGRVIDAATQAGASRVDGLRLMLKDEEPSRNAALRAAGQKARARAEAIAGGLGTRIGVLRSAEEGISYRPLTVDARAVAAAATPIETGTLEVRAQITVEYETAP